MPQSDSCSKKILNPFVNWTITKTVSTVCVQVCSGVRNKPQVTRVPSTRESQTAKETHASVSDAVITPQFRKICCWESDRNRAMNSDVNSMPYLRRWLDSGDHRDEKKNERTPNCASSRPNPSARSAYHSNHHRPQVSNCFRSQSPSSFLKTLG